jgi:biopolymer transport protein ExbD
MAKLKFKPSGRSECNLDLTPMIDVTFQLIAFFMFVLNVNEFVQNQAIRLPASDLAKPPEKAPRTVFTVQVTRPEEDGKSYVYFANRKLALDGDELKAAIDKERTILGFERRSPDDPSIVVLIRGDAAAKAGEVQRVVDAWREKGFVQFSLRARQEAD